MTGTFFFKIFQMLNFNVNFAPEKLKFSIYA